MPRGASSPARGRHREEDDRRLLPLELVDRADADARQPLGQQPHLRVVGRDDDHVARAARDESARLDLGRDRRRPPPPTTSGCPRARPAASARPSRPRTPARAPRGLEPALVERRRDVAADVRVHAPRVVEEEAAVLRNGRVLAEQVLEHRAPGAGRVDRLRHLRELHRVAEQDEVARRRARARARPRATPARPRRRRGSRASVDLGRQKSQAVPATSCTSGSAKSASAALSIQAPS